MNEEVEFKSEIARMFSRASTTYDHVGPRFFSYFGKKLVEFGAPHQGSRVLDIACGRGAVLFPAAEVVLDSGEVVGIDISPGMITQVRRDIRKNNVGNVHVHVMDAEDLDFDGSTFDVVFCGLCLFFFPNLDRALSEIYRVLKPGGAMVASTFKKDKPDELTHEWEQLHKSFKDVITEVPQTETANLNTVREIKTRFGAAGFGNIRVVTRRKTFYYKDEEQWWQTAWSHGYRAYLERIPEEFLPDFKARAIEIVQKTRTPQGIPYRWDLLFTQASKCSEREIG